MAAIMAAKSKINGGSSKNVSINGVMAKYQRHKHQ
jgi:hypothetical protein